MKLFTNKESVTKEIFAAYLRGGRMWPQMRWANNILIIDAIFSSKQYNFSNTSDWKRFSQTILSSQQLLSLEAVMRKDHLKASIFPARSINGQKLHSEWEKTKVGIYKTFLSFKQKKLENYLDEDNENEMAKETFNMQNLEFCIENYEYQFLMKIISCAKETISTTADLANLFRLTYYPLKDKETFFKKVGIKPLFEKYNLPLAMISGCPKALREEIKYTVFKIIYQNVFEISQKECFWIIYDPNWANYYKSKGDFNEIKRASIF